MINSWREVDAAINKLIQKVEDLYRQVTYTNSTQIGNQTTVDGDATFNGLVTIRAPKILCLTSGNEPTDSDASGVFMSAAGETFGEDTYNIGGVENGGLQFGIRSTDGVGVFSGGDATIGADGIAIDRMGYLMSHTATDGTTERTGSMGMWSVPGGTAPCYGFSLNAPADETDIMDGTNAGFETGDFTGWTKTTETIGNWIMYSASTSTWNIFEGTYMPFFEYAGSTSSAITGVLTKDRDEVTAGTRYLVQFGLACSGYGTTYYAKVEIKWYDHASAGSLIKTDQIAYQKTNSFPSLTAHNAFVTAPSGALSCEVVVTGHSAARANNVLAIAVDGFTMNATSISANLYFDSTGELHLNDDPLLPEILQVPGMWTSTATLTLNAVQHAYTCVAADAANGNVHTLKIPPLAKGTYTVLFNGGRGTDRGKVDWTLDGASIATGQDWYVASAAEYFFTVTDVTVATTGTHVLVGTINGKNASSSDYAFYVYNIYFIKTA